MFTIRYRTVFTFAAGLAVALIGVFVFNSWRADAAPGDRDSTFVPITPCRLIDTRPAPDRVGTLALFGPDDTKTIQARGSNGNCTVPNEAIGLSLNVTAVGASQATFLTFWPGGARPTVSNVNPAPGQPPTPNAVTTKLSASGSFDVYNRFGTVDVIIDVGGYYAKTSLQELQAQIDALTAAQPFAVSSPTNYSMTITTPPQVIAAVSLTAPVAGQVTLNSVTQANEAEPSDRVECSITTGSTVDVSHEQTFESPGSDGSNSQMAGTRTYDIAKDATGTYNLVCQHNGSSGSSNLYSSLITAIFTPAP